MQLSEIFPSRMDVIKKLEKIGVSDPAYLKAVGGLKLGEIFPDVRLFGYEVAVRKNLRFKSDYPESAKEYWIFGETGQGDLWLLGRNPEHVVWFDHNQGEFPEGVVLDFGLGFEEFVKMAFVIRDAELALDSDESYFDARENREKFETALNEIRQGLPEVYPYKYY